MRYLSLSDEDRKEILEKLGYKSEEELFKDATGEEKFTESIDLPSLSEVEVYNRLFNLSLKNAFNLKVFAGGGAYDVYTPAVVNHILLRSEFYTAYTPYQPEVSQGTLQAMFEFQSFISDLTRMEVTNASMYDGGTSLAEAILMSFRLTRKYKVLIPKSLNPLYKMVIKTYLPDFAEVEEYSFTPSGSADVVEISSKIDAETASLVVQSPNYFGIVENTKILGSLAKERNLIYIVHYDPVAVAILTPPGEAGADIATAEGQVLGIPLSFGGPYVGLFSSLKKHIRQMPGRIVAETVDANGRRGYVTTLQTREQFIRREKATSNICTNNQLVALAVTVYLALIGKRGLIENAKKTLAKTKYFVENLPKGYKVAFDGFHFREVVVKTPVKAKEVRDRLIEKGFLVGPIVEELGEDYLIFAFTEKHTKEDIDKLLEELGRS
jgi:Glycine cleavage system protein P (pyridoxal-binding), N-terminal domain